MFDLPAITVETVLWLVLLIPSITLHEFMHGYAAYRLGDPTAKNAGRLTLNPVASIDPFGSVILPLMLFVTGGPIFGYAKPVPVNPNNFADVRKGDLITGLAGPAANLGLALLGAALAWTGVAVAGGVEAIGYWLYVGGFALTQTNLVLMFFNLIPIPPLDGSSIIPILLPDSMLRGWYQLQRYAFAILIGLLFVLPFVFGFSPISWYFQVTVYPLMQLLLPV